MQTPERFGPFVLEAQLESSPQIEHWRAAEQTSEGDRPCILKRLSPHYREFVALRERLTREGRIASRMVHRGIHRCLRHGELDALPYVAYERIEGLKLRELVDLGGCPVAPAVELAGRICDALDQAQRTFVKDDAPYGMVHGALSPYSIILGTGDTLRVTDFGAADPGGRAPLCADVVHPEQLPYTPPEVATQQSIDGRNDLFALGAMIIELLTAEAAFPFGISAQEDPASRIHQLCRNARNGVVPTRLTELLVSMTGVDLEIRPSSAREVVRTLQVIWSELNEPTYLRDYLQTQIFRVAPPREQTPVLPFWDRTGGWTPTPMGPRSRPSSLLTPVRGSAPPRARPSGFEVLPRQSSAPPTQSRNTAPRVIQRLGPLGMRMLCGYRPYLLALGMEQDQRETLTDTSRYSYYYVSGDQFGPRIVQKSEDSQSYGRRNLTYLAGSRMYDDGLGQLLNDAEPLPEEAASLLGLSGTLADRSGELASLISTHEASLYGKEG